jgi:hypothetical protein
MSALETDQEIYNLKCMKFAMRWESFYMMRELLLFKTNSSLSERQYFAIFTRPSPIRLPYYSEKSPPDEYDHYESQSADRSILFQHEFPVYSHSSFAIFLAVLP